MKKILCSAVLVSLLAACTSRTTYVTEDRDAGTSTTTNPTLAVPAGCDLQPSAVARQYCASLEALVVCRDAIEPDGCKMSIRENAYCCPLPPATNDPRVTALCAGVEECSLGLTDTRTCEASVEARRTGECASAYEALFACVTASDDMCTPWKRCSAEYEAYFDCQVSIVDGGCSVSDDPQLCVNAYGDGYGDAATPSVAFTCSKEPTEHIPSCGIGSKSTNGMPASYFRCCKKGLDVF